MLILYFVSNLVYHWELFVAKQLNESLFDWLINLYIDWFIDWLIDRSIDISHLQCTIFVKCTNFSGRRGIHDDIVVYIFSIFQSTPDDLPVIDKHPTYPNIAFACGMSGKFDCHDSRVVVNESLNESLIQGLESSTLCHFDDSSPSHCVISIG